ncbi:MAG: nitrilotriacetate monooxygenase [Rhodospirillaceae bacterium]|nr:nitrilotriacetate monooxygenase [Rhodospirillaceae bacterium]
MSNYSEEVESSLGPTASENARLAFRQVLGQFCTGVTAITTVAQNRELIGITVNSFSSLSLEPPLILWNIDSASPNFNNFDMGEPFAVNVFAQDQQALAEQFATSGIDKFSGVKTHLGLKGVPIIDGCVAYLECDVESRYPGGDHDIIVGKVRKISNFRRAPLLFHGGEFHSLPVA